MTPVKSFRKKQHRTKISEEISKFNCFTVSEIRKMGGCENFHEFQSRFFFRNIFRWLFIIYIHISICIYMWKATKLLSSFLDNWIKDSADLLNLNCQQLRAFSCPLGCPAAPVWAEVQGGPCRKTQLFS